MAKQTFTQSVTLSGTSNSFAWNAPSNWMSGVLPAAGDSVVIGASTGSGAVSYDNLNLGGPLMSLQVLSGAPLLDIAPGTSLTVSGPDINGPLFNAGSIEVEALAELAALRLPQNNLILLAGTAEFPDFLNQGTFDFQGHGADLFLSAPQPIWHNVSSNDVENFDIGDALFLRGWVYTHSYPSYAAFVTGTTLTVEGLPTHGEPRVLYESTDFNVAPDVAGLNAAVVSQVDPLRGTLQNFLELTAVCFVAGTRITTERGDVAVEELSQDDRIVTVAGDDHALRAITWIGHRRIDLTSQKCPESLFPIRIHRGALAENLPQRDLLVSPDHCLFVDGQLIPAKLLVNGMSIVQDRSFRTVHYYHVELATHDVLLAEGLPAETYLDTGNRNFFANTAEPVSLHPVLDADRLQWQQQLCAPLRLRSTEIEPIWTRLAARAESLGYARPEASTSSDPELRLVVAGRSFRPVACDGDRYSFVVPRLDRELRVVSRFGRPVDAVRHTNDWRRLGVAVRRISVQAGNRRVDITADHPMLSEGWHPVEHGADGPWRWTDGDAAVPLPAVTGRVTVQLTLAGPMTYRLEAPALVA